MLWVQPTYAQGLAVAGDDMGIWVLIPEPDTPEAFSVLHRARQDPPGQMNKFITLHGDIRPHSVSARDHTLWIIYPHGQVQSFRAKPTPLEDGWMYDNQVEPSLPGGVTVRTSTMTASGLWALVRVDELEALEKLDRLQKPTEAFP